MSGCLLLCFFVHTTGEKAKLAESKANAVFNQVACLLIWNLPPTQQCAERNKSCGEKKNGKMGCLQHFLRDAEFCLEKLQVKSFFSFTMTTFFKLCMNPQ